MKISFSFNKGKVLTSLRALNERLTQEAHAGAQRTAERAEELAKEYVPEDTGLLKETIRIERIGDRPSRRGYRLIVGSDDLMSNPKYPQKMIKTSDYARLVHEDYWSSVAILPGMITAAKINTYGPARVTEGFLRHAMKDAVDEFEKNFNIQIDKARLKFNS